MRFSFRMMCVVIVASALLPSVAYAHGDDTWRPATRRNMMERMMGDRSFDRLDGVERDLLGPARQERMETLMERMMQGTMTDTEQDEMVGMMRTMGGNPGMMSMMMRMMAPSMMERGFATPMRTAFAERSLGFPTATIALILGLVNLALLVVALQRKHP